MNKTIFTIPVLIISITGCVSQPPVQEIVASPNLPSPIPSTALSCSPMTFGPVCQWRVDCQEDHAQASLICTISVSSSDLVLFKAKDTPFLIAFFSNHYPGRSGAIRIGNNQPILVTDNVNGSITNLSLIDELIAGEVAGEKLYWSHAQWLYKQTTGEGSVPLAGFNEAITYADKWLSFN